MATSALPTSCGVTATTTAQGEKVIPVVIPANLVNGDRRAPARHPGRRLDNRGDDSKGERVTKKGFR